MRPLKRSYSGLEPNTFKYGAQFCVCHFMFPNFLSFFALPQHTNEYLFQDQRLSQPRIWTEKCQKINVKTICL